MKKLLFVVLVLLTFQAMSQKIKVSEYDKFIKMYRIEAEKAVMKNNLNGFIYVKMRSVGSTIFFVIDGRKYISGGVKDGADLILLFSNDSTLTIHSKETQLTHRGDYGDIFNNFEYFATKANIQTIKRNTVKSMRFYTLEGYFDIDIKEEDAKDLSNLCDVFLKEYDAKSSLTK